MDGEDYRTGSAAESENGSDNSYVKVSSEDMDPPDSQPTNDSPQLISGTGIAPDEEDTFGSKGTDQETVQPPTGIKDDPFYMESYPPETEEKIPPSPHVEVKPGVQDVGPVQSGPPKKPSASPDLTAPKATGYLSFLNALHPAVLYVVYWKDIKLSAVVLGVELIVLLTLTLNTFLHTLVLLLLSILVVSLTYIVTKIAIDSFYNREIKNPFSKELSGKIALPEEKILEWMQYFVHKLSYDYNVLVRLLLFDNIKKSLKFGLVLWLASFVTNCMNILTTMFFVVVVSFTVPPLYAKYQKPIDAIVKQVLCKGCEIFNMVKSRIPYLNKSKVD